MIVDGQHQFSAAQALSGAGSAASTNVIDLTADRNVGIGQPMAAVITVGTALAGTSPTFAAALQTATDSAFSSPVTLVTGPTISGAANMPAGSKFVLLYPAGAEMLQYLRINYTLGGTSPTATVTAYLQPANEVQNAEVFYAKNYTIS